MLLMILLYVVLYDVFVPEYCELLLQRRFFLNGDVKFDQGGMDVAHDFEEVISEGDMDGWRIDELVESIFIKALNEMVQKDFIEVGS